MATNNAPLFLAPSRLPAKPANPPAELLPTSAASIAALLPPCSGGIIRARDTYSFGRDSASKNLNLNVTPATRANKRRESQKREAFSTQVAFSDADRNDSGVLWSCS